MNEIRKIFQVMIGEKLYDVYDIPSKEFDSGNGEVKTWWVYFADSLPEGVTPPIDSPNWEHLHISIKRHCWDITFKQRTRVKEKWGSNQFSNNTSCKIFCNGKIFYSFGTSGGPTGLSFAMSKAEYMITALSEHPFDFYNPQKENGRKIYWYGLPAFVKVWREDTPWEIGIAPDYTHMSKEEWWKEYERRKSCINKQPDEFDEIEKESDGEAKENDMINWGDAFSDQHINWFRKD